MDHLSPEYLVAIVALTTLLSNWVTSALSGGFRFSRRLSTIETTLSSFKDEFSKVGDILEKMSDIRGDFKEVNARLNAGDQRMTAVEQDVRELRHGDGFVQRSIEGEWPR